MRVAMAVLTGFALAAGVGMSPGRAPSVDMVSGGYGAGVPNPTHLGHWESPVEGRAVFISANAMEAGTGAGSATFGVLVVGTGVVCTLSIPCTTTPETFLSTDCPDNVAATGAEVHLEFSHTCTTPPEGNAVFGFEWAR